MLSLESATPGSLWKAEDEFSWAIWQVVPDGPVRDMVTWVPADVPVMRMVYSSNGYSVHRDEDKVHYVDRVSFLANLPMTATTWTKIVDKSGKPW